MKKILAVTLFAMMTILSSCGDEVEVVTIKTKYGDMIAILYDETPKHKENFLKLVNDKFYDSTYFHRIVQGFMIQGGDPNSKTAPLGTPLGNGGPGYNIPAEINPKFYHEKGALSAARLGDEQNPKKESSGSQFYIVQGSPVSEAMLGVNEALLQSTLREMYMSGKYQPMFDSLEMTGTNGGPQAQMDAIMALIPRIEKINNVSIKTEVPEEKRKAYTTVGGAPFLDGQYTVFGKVIGGLDVLDKIAGMPVGPSPMGEMSMPQEKITISVTTKKMSKKQIEKEYGYTFPAK